MSDWLTDPAKQIEWGLKHIEETYGSPDAALAASRIIELQPDDVLVLECPTRLNAEWAHRISETLKGHFKDRKVIVLDNGMTLRAFRDSPPDTGGTGEYVIDVR